MGALPAYRRASRLFAATAALERGCGVGVVVASLDLIFALTSGLRQDEIVPGPARRLQQANVCLMSWALGQQTLTSLTTRTLTDRGVLLVTPGNPCNVRGTAPTYVPPYITFASIVHCAGYDANTSNSAGCFQPSVLDSR